MNKYAILTVIYHENEEQFNMAIRTWDSFPKDADIYAVFNRKYKDGEYPKNIKYLTNDENCLAKAWNMGLTEIFKKYDYAIVSGLDSMSPPEYDLNILVEALSDNPNYGITSAVPMGMVNGVEDIEHGDGSFSFFCISKNTFEALTYEDKGKEKVGFNENYKPAYFEDNDYLERLWDSGYTPKRFNNITYYHLFQGSVKHGQEIARSYGDFMQKNLELFKKTYGKVPDHLPKDIVFKNAR